MYSTNHIIRPLPRHITSRLQHRLDHNLLARPILVPAGPHLKQSRNAVAPHPEELDQPHSDPELRKPVPHGMRHALRVDARPATPVIAPATEPVKPLPRRPLGCDGRQGIDLVAPVPLGVYRLVEKRRAVGIVPGLAWVPREASPVVLEVVARLLLDCVSELLPEGLVLP